jgi:hypothetical protein
VSLIYECVVCNKKTVSGKAAEIEESACCMSCAEEHNHPGKFERYMSIDPRYFDAESMGTVLILDVWANSGGEDEYMTQEGWGYLGRFGKYLLHQDTQGFVTYDEYESEEKALKEYDKLYKDGWGASEDDIYLTHDRGWEAWQSGKQISVYARKGFEYDDKEGIDRRRVLAAISVHMRKTGFYPDVWEESGHGNLTCISEEIW